MASDPTKYKRPNGEIIEIRPSSYLSLISMVCFNPFSQNSTDPQCRICFLPEGKSIFDRTSSPLVTPCRCRGSRGFVHLDCLYLWKKISMRSKCEVCQERFVFRGKYYQQNVRVLLHIWWMNLCSDGLAENDNRAWEEGLSMYYHDVMDPIFDTFIKPFIPSEDCIITVTILVFIFSFLIWCTILFGFMSSFITVCKYLLLMRRRRIGE